MFQCFYPDAPCDCKRCKPTAPEEAGRQHEPHPLLPDRSDLRQLPEVRRQIEALTKLGVPAGRIHVSGEGTGYDCEFPVVTVLPEPERGYVPPDDTW